MAKLPLVQWVEGLRLASASILVFAALGLTASCSSVEHAITGHPGGGTGDAVVYAGASAAEVECLKELNNYRAQAGVGPLNLDSSLSEFSRAASQALAATGVAHGYFTSASQDQMSQAGFCNGGAENQAPGWPADDLNAGIHDALKAMMDEGPGGGHHDNMLNGDYTKVGIGILVVKGRLYLTNDFSTACSGG